MVSLYSDEWWEELGAVDKKITPAKWYKRKMWKFVVLDARWWEPYVIMDAPSHFVLACAQYFFVAPTPRAAAAAVAAALIACTPSRGISGVSDLFRIVRADVRTHMLNFPELSHHNCAGSFNVLALEQNKHKGNGPRHRRVLCFPPSESKSGLPELYLESSDANGGALTLHQ